MPDPEVSKRFLVHGRVQGVGFRDSVARFAWKLGGLKGHVRNTRDGRVEVCVTAPGPKVEQLRAFLHQGPPLARVDRVEERPLEQPAPAGPFCIVFGG